MASSLFTPPAPVEAPLTSVGLLVLRVSISAWMLTHGWGKLMTLMAGESASFPDPLGVGHTLSHALAVLGEVLGPTFVLLGFLARWAAIPSVLTMAVAAFIVHAGDPWAKKELACLYGLMFLVVVIVGPGRFSLDGARAKRR